MLTKRGPLWQSPSYNRPAGHGLSAKVWKMSQGFSIRHYVSVTQPMMNGKNRPALPPGTSLDTRVASDKEKKTLLCRSVTSETTMKKKTHTTLVCNEKDKEIKKKKIKASETTVNEQLTEHSCVWLHKAPDWSRLTVGGVLLSVLSVLRPSFIFFYLWVILHFPLWDSEHFWENYKVNSLKIVFEKEGEKQQQLSKKVRKTKSRKTKEKWNEKCGCQKP